MNTRLLPAFGLLVFLYSSCSAEPDDNLKVDQQGPGGSATGSAGTGAMAGGSGGETGGSGSAGASGDGASGAGTGGSGDGASGAGTGGTGGTTGELGDCGAVTQKAENKLQPVDIIIGVDTTGSMREEIGFTEQNMNAFSQQIIDAGIDVRVFLISGAKEGPPQDFTYVDGLCIDAPLGSGACPDDSNMPGYLHIAEKLADWDVLQKYIDLYPTYKQYLRESSFKTFVSISDGDIAANFLNQQPINTADEFTAAVAGLEPGSQMWANWRYSGIYCFSQCNNNTIGATHAALVQQTQGVGGDLCLQDFKPVFDDLVKQVTEVVTLECDWDIPPPPQGETFDADKTNVQLTLEGTAEQLGQAATAADCASRDGWYYDDSADPKRVVACPATCTRIQAALNAEVALLFGCETVVLPPLE